MVKYKIEHKKEECIGCGACTSVAEKFWEMGQDGKANLIGSKKNENED